ncbi:MAG: magnesium transporter CorA family protein [Planctomycetota bacterium]|nr:magnesium transporter CorA family protein [Planctomycetota bacterium]
MITSFYLTPEGKLTQGLSEDDMRAAIKGGKGVLWVDFERPTEDETFLLDEVFNFHPLSIEDCQQHKLMMPKMDEFPSHLFIVFLAPDPKKDVTVAEEEEFYQQIALFVGRNYVVTYHARPCDLITAAIQRVRRDPAGVIGRGADFLANDVMDGVVDQYFPVVDKLHTICEKMEDQAVDPKQPADTLASILAIKRRILALRRLMIDHREVLQRMMRSPHPVVSEKANMYYRDIMDHLTAMEDDLDVCRDTIDGARDLCVNVANLRVQEIIRLLTGLFTITLPAALVTAFYGMNFSDLPLRMEDESGAWIAMGVTVVMTLGVYLWLRRKRIL